HYGRICPIDTSEGINVGLIGSLAIHARIGCWGSLESPFYKISERSKGAQMLYLSPGRDEYYMVAAGNSLALNQGIQEEQIGHVILFDVFVVGHRDLLHVSLDTSIGDGVFSDGGGGGGVNWMIPIR
ncbi:hypothetical protein R6Q59_013657, partial [Mikania micrantha]